MTTKLNLIMAALVLVVASSAMAQDKGTKVTAMPFNPAPQVVDNGGGQVAWQKPTAALTHGSRLHEVYEAKAPAAVVVAEGVRTQRGAAADVAYPRGTAAAPVMAAPAQDAPRSGNKPSFYAMRGQ